ncbi:hypothetical protein A9D46_16590 [Photobacterium damselae subsp. damselae]|uniref:restriction endonuclease subunit S n=1 Tax=Photobacterium damselae TaxID=38293 RepID=UPI00084B4801|nr:restriction endonuclease subunit S [Photobacterium damselae]OEC81855.1 hypothetical protein A9D46_16590 [Photobacterium damselae subsp. damselae]
MSELPKGWVASSIGEACLIENGLRKPISLKERASCQGHYPYYGATGVIDYLNNYTHEGEYVLIGEDGANLLSKSKPLAFIAKGKYWVNNHAHTLRCLADSPNLYLEKYFNSLSLESWVTGSAQPKLTKKNLESIPYPLAPLNEQKRIVEKLDEVLAQVDTIKARLDGIPVILKRFRQSVLAAAVSGKLTEEWRMENIFNAKAQLKAIKDQNPSKPPKDELAIFDKLPRCWEWALVKQVGEVQLGRQRAPKYHQGNNMRPYLRVANVMEGYIDTSDVMEMVFDESDFERYKLVKGDVLLNEGQSHELVGRPSLFNDELENVCFTNTLVRFRAYDGVHNKFAYFVFLNQMKTGRFQQIASRTVNISHLGAGRFADIEFPFPSIEEQKEIGRLVEQYFAFADAIEAQVKKAQTRVDNLTQSILAKAFRGELVDQDPNDEPADKLLERIAAARKEAEALAKAAKKAQSTKSVAKKKTAKSA